MDFINILKKYIRSGKKIKPVQKFGHVFAIRAIVRIFAVIFLLGYLSGTFMVGYANETYEDKKNRWVKNHDTITIGYLDDYSPFTDVRKRFGEDDKVSDAAYGIFIDIIKYSFKKLNIYDYYKEDEIIYQSYESFEEMVSDLKKGKIDLMAPGFDNDTYAEENDLLQSYDIATCEMLYIYKDKENIFNDVSKEDSTKKVAVSENIFIQEKYLMKSYNMHEDRLLKRKSLNECLEAVKKGLVAGTIMNSYGAKVVLRNYSDLKTISLKDEVSFCFYSSKKNKDLMAIINKGISFYGFDNISESLIKNTDIAYGIYNDDVASFIKQHSLVIFGCCLAVVSLIIFLIMLSVTKDREGRRFNDMAHRDIMTELLNRRAYEEEYSKLIKKGRNLDRNLIYACLDVNDLKGTNDALGHAAGDELIIATAKCIKEVVNNKGNIYRIGGDEFVAIFTAGKLEFENMKNQMVTAFDNWTGIMVKSLSVSVGFASSREFSNATVEELARIADGRMYKEKFARKDTYKVRTNTGTIRDVEGYGFLYKNEEEQALLDAFMLAYSAQYDTLTGIPTMSYFLEMINSSYNSKNFASKNPAMITFNFNDFKNYNFRFGLQGGDELLVIFAKILEEIFGMENISRFGEDRFYAFSTEEEVEEKVKKVFEEMSKANEGKTLSVRAGIYVYSKEEEAKRHASSACDKARIACEHNKKSRESSYRFFDSEMDKEIKWRNFIIYNLDNAIENGHIIPFYQPQVLAINNEIYGFEALTRWIDPQRGMLLPGDFIPILEEYNITYKLDKYIANMVAKDMLKIIEEGREPLPVSVNISRSDFLMSNPCDDLISIVEEYELPRELFKVEITESNIISDPYRMKKEIEKFRSEGFQVLMDDFGSGQSSLGTLRDFEFDAIKIDMGFMKNFDERSKSIIKPIVMMARSLGIHSLTEGVENKEQLDFLREIGCEFIQGYYYGKPAPFESLYKEGRGVGKLVINEAVKNRQKKNLLNKKEKSKDKDNEQDMAIEIFKKIYNTVHALNLEEDYYEEIVANYSIHKFMGEKGSLSSAMSKVTRVLATKDNLDDIWEFVNINTLPQRLSDSDFIEYDFKSNTGEWIKSAFFVLKRDNNNKVVKVLFVTRYITKK
ncbi:diguanylate cyclase (GGDEF) domain-containing protein [Acetitomaculum ruminis DSM 5522]|uniref:Diguanylate cyclase (GGDEF) domain-containing protein n=1 Tax=Acetitomaculum ruminis DSM 5522 TaxID=1120918 RepID=A0A1I0X9F2_9FIRM|nr:EAL domain-containing protein [Acetitomaculum ruminis]SFA96960.1 diguanylate cyclase (GGDEF) domain-containing protein [Acetitomaculum ruminis DSM 5522]